jgi:hypothetical protein
MAPGGVLREGVSESVDASILPFSRDKLEFRIATRLQSDRDDLRANNPSRSPMPSK